jgi:hypothetical protein
LVAELFIMRIYCRTILFHIGRLADEEIQDMVITANLTPTKCLGFRAPIQAILKELAKTPKFDSLRPVALRTMIDGLHKGSALYSDLICQFSSVGLKERTFRV